MIKAGINIDKIGIRLTLPHRGITRLVDSVVWVSVYKKNGKYTIYEDRIETFNCSTVSRLDNILKEAVEKNWNYIESEAIKIVKLLESNSIAIGKDEMRKVLKKKIEPLDILAERINGGNK